MIKLTGTISSSISDNIPTQFTLMWEIISSLSYTKPTLFTPTAKSFFLIICHKEHIIYYVTITSFFLTILGLVPNLIAQGKVCFTFNPNHIWKLPVLRYHKIMPIYPYPFLVVNIEFFSLIIFINDCICILNGLPR